MFGPFVGHLGSWRACAAATDRECRGWAGSYRRWSTSLRRRGGWTADRRDQPFVILHTGIAAREMGGNAWKVGCGVTVGELALHVTVEQLEGFGASRVRGIGPQETFQGFPAAHVGLEASLSRYPSVTSAARN